jgi:hypothetical protein
MKSSCWLFVLLIGGILVGSIYAGGNETFSHDLASARTEYFAVNRAGRPRDPQLLFLMGQYVHMHVKASVFLSLKKISNRAFDGRSPSISERWDYYAPGIQQVPFWKESDGSETIEI